MNAMASANNAGTLAFGSAFGTPQPTQASTANNEAFGTQARASPAQQVHISHLADFDPLSEPQQAPSSATMGTVVAADTGSSQWDASSSGWPGAAGAPTKQTAVAGTNGKLTKTVSEMDDLQKLSMLVSRGTLNEAEKMVARELVVERIPGISEAIDSAVCKNKGKLVAMMAHHQSMPFPSGGGNGNGGFGDDFDDGAGL